MSSKPPVFKKTDFPYLDLDRINGQPTIDQTVKIYKQIKQNASRVTTTLAGGQHGYLPLALTLEQWERVPHVEAFDHPQNPDPFASRAYRVASAKIAIDRICWEQRLQNYNMCPKSGGDHAKQTQRRL